MRELFGGLKGGSEQIPRLFAQRVAARLTEYDLRKMRDTYAFCTNLEFVLFDVKVVPRVRRSGLLGIIVPRFALTVTHPCNPAIITLLLDMCCFLAGRSW